jgi:hypothetical protein
MQAPVVHPFVNRLPLRMREGGGGFERDGIDQSRAFVAPRLQARLPHDQRVFGEAGNLNASFSFQHRIASSHRHCFVVLKNALLISEIADENNFLEVFATITNNGLAVGRPREAEDTLGLESGQLPRRAAVNRLQPQIRRTVACGNVGQRAAVRRPFETVPIGARHLAEHLRRGPVAGRHDGRAQPLRFRIEVKTGDPVSVR